MPPTLILSHMNPVSTVPFYIFKIQSDILPSIHNSSLWSLSFLQQYPVYISLFCHVALPISSSLIWSPSEHTANKNHEAHLYVIFSSNLFLLSLLDPNNFLNTSYTLCLRSFVNKKQNSYFIECLISLGKSKNHLNEMGFNCESCDVLLGYLMSGDLSVLAIFYNLAI